jgi:hypothetical protein
MVTLLQFAQEAPSLFRGSYGALLLPAFTLSMGRSMSDPTDPTFWDKILVGSTAAVAWLSGEMGRVVVAGAAGGLYRWLMEERKRLREGIIAIVSGAVGSVYLGPIVMRLLEIGGLSVTGHPSGYMTAGFLAGMTGVSLAKVAIAVIEVQAKKLRGGNGQ